MSIERARRRLSAAAAVIGLGLLLVLAPMASPASAAAPATTLDSSFASLLNGLRSTLGLGGLAVDGELSAVATRWSEHMARTNVLAHNTAVKDQVSGYSKLGENVGTGNAVLEIFNALVASPAHLRNMSDPEFTKIGVGTVTDGRGRVWTTHVFLRPKAGAAAPAPPAAAPAPAPAPTAPRAPRPAPTTTARPPAPSTTAAPPAPVPTPPTVPTPTPVEVAEADTPTEASLPPAAPVLAAADLTSEGDVPLPAVAALLGLLLILGGLGVARSRREAAERLARTDRVGHVGHDGAISTLRRP